MKMDEHYTVICCFLGYTLVVLAGHVLTDTDTGSISNPSKSRAYFNNTLPSLVTLSGALDLNQDLVFSFRTCSYGQLVYQQGQSGDYIRYALLENGTLELSYKVGVGVRDTLVSDSLRNNQWHTVVTRLEDNAIYIFVTNTSSDTRILVSNNSSQPILQDIDLSAGGSVQVGAGFSGCIEEGTGLSLSAHNAQAQNIIWGECALEDQQPGICESAVVNPCWPYPCPHPQVCIDQGESFQCVCPTSSNGQDCYIGGVDCDLTPCQNNGTCQSQGNASNTDHCYCAEGYTGVYCELPTQECDSQPCQHGGTCRQGEGNYTCLCSGEYVNLTKYTGNPNSTYWIGFEGVNCELDVDECMLKPNICLNNGICQKDRNNPFGFKCYCPSGQTYFTGKYCHFEKNYCAVHQVDDPPLCHNGGTCNDIIDNYSCNCTAGFTGERCKTNINECASDPCLHNSTCVDGVDGYTCACAPGYTGVVCEDEIDECLSQPCENQGGCQDRINGFECNCTDTGFNGTTCQLNLDECQSNPCQHQGTCIDGVKQYTCTCHQGYAGPDCSIDFDECASSPCSNNATCRQRSTKEGEDFNVSQASGYDCECPEGFTAIHCETNIDECESDPCIHGECQDLIGGYECFCHAGYHGNNCELELDECQMYQPCQNGGTCSDRVADYMCACPPEYEGKSYGGRNCTVELIGCQDNRCDNNATCKASYITEHNIHNYSCDCLSGFYGHLCDISTTASFSGNSWIRYDGTKNKDSVSLKILFRTTLPEGILFLNKIQGSSEYFLLHLADGGVAVKLVYKTSQSTVSVVAHTPSRVSLSNAEWHQVEVNISRNQLDLILVNQECPQMKCISSKTVPSAMASGQLSLGATYIGGQPSLLANTSVVGFVGCMQDMVFDLVWLVPANYVNHLEGESENLQEGCPRVDQCSPDPCNDKGVCSDLWTDFKCSCQRLYAGRTCSQSMKPATFGFAGQQSHAQFTVPPSQSDQLAHSNDISLFFRTRKPSGLLFYIGGDSRGPPENTTFMAADLIGGNLRMRVRFGSSIKTFMVEGDFANGRQIFFQVVRDESELVVSVDSIQRNFNISDYTYPLHPRYFFLGGFPEVSTNRRRRDLSGPPELPIEADFLKGTLQDTRSSGMLLQFQPLNTTDIYPSYDAPVMDNVEMGEVTDDICSLTQPCLNNATCSNQFFNDYYCNCTEDFRGKNCSLLNFCHKAKCPVDSVCRDLNDGYECLAAATFDGETSYLRFGHNLLQSTKLSSVSLNFRTRRTEGVLFHIRGAGLQSDLYVTLSLVSGAVNLDGNLKSSFMLSGGSDTNLSDANWHNVSATFSSTVSLQVDKAESVTISGPMTLLDILPTSDIYLGGVTSDYQDTHTYHVQDKFKGCLDDVRLGGTLLSIFSQSEIVNNSAAEQFWTSDRVGVLTGCHGDPVCDSDGCMNNATCVDIWNAYECDCLVGFNGTMCQNDIDDCVDNECQNEASCVDGIANYTCDCAPGFTGDRCQINIDECDSDPCQNNGTCLDGINIYVCNCTEEYTGDVCEIQLTGNCSTTECLNGGTCVDYNTTYEGVVSFNCTCAPGYTGTVCEQEIDFCVDNACENNATCESQTELLNYTCNCTDGYEGYNCEQEIDECESDPCQNGGTCHDELSGYQCNCTSGWEGVHCESDIDECNVTSSPCVNGECINRNGSFECNCTGTGYEGDLCQDDINECNSTDGSPCQNNATCSDEPPGDYFCNCTLGYEGKNCDIANCSHGQCEHNSSCTVSSSGQWQCDCLDFFEGLRCEIRGPCVDDPCQNNGHCEQEGTNYTCKCAEGWEGVNCTEDIDECASSPCDNNGTCNNEIGSYYCNCTAGFTGDNCETNIDECASNPCQNQGRCIDQDNGYICDCSGTGFNGTHCEEDIKECESSPCLNDGTCKETQHVQNKPAAPFFTCDCQSGYVGNRCHLTDPCNDTSLCKNDGNCSDIVSDDNSNVTYHCTCVAPWEGPTCELTTESESADHTALIIGLSVSAIFIILFIVLVVLLVTARSKRATRGAYSPSRQERDGSRLQMGSVLKPPTEERLI